MKEQYFSVALRDDRSRESATQWLLLLDRETAARANGAEPEGEADREAEGEQEGGGAPAGEGQRESEIS